MKKIIKILLAVCAPLWLAFSCAHAEEVEVVPDVEYSGSMKYSGYNYAGNPYTNTVITSKTGTAGTNAKWYRGPYLITGYKTIGSSSSNNSSGNVSYYCTDLNYAYANSETYDFNLSIEGMTVNLYSADLVVGENYHFITDIYFGVGFYDEFNNGSAVSCMILPTYSGDGGTIYFTDQSGDIEANLSFEGFENIFVTGSYDSSYHTQLAHFTLDSYFTYSSGNWIIYDFGSAIRSIMPTLSYDMSDVRALNFRRYFHVVDNYRFKSQLFAGVLLPTPTPTPSPNQDIINNSNQNTTNIISSINNGFDALAAAFEGTIYGFTDLFFGGLSDWLDFFSDVETDFEENLPVVQFFSSVRNIFANFFPEVSATDPSALQFVAGWQSDLYVLHVPALSLVLPEGTFPFFPEVNFDLNNDFMNLIRPYWLTFCNLLVTLLWFRYLLHYLFRWSQLLTGNTAAAFELFMHQPEELDQLAGIGEDPYDLASDYTYDEIDSEFHDTYQAAEHHYGHGAARYLSGVLHGRIKP